MKKFLVVIGALVGLLLLTMILVPIIFKDDIKKAVDDAMADNINAQVFYDPDGINLTLFSNFPNLTFGLSQFGLSGNDQFEGDTLVSVGSFEIVIDLMSVISGDQITINSIILDQPAILIKVLADGSANYDIAKTSEEAPEETTDASEPSAFSIGIKKWEIINGSMDYIDESLAFTTSLKGLNHTGSGDFALDIFDMLTKTTVDDFSLAFEGVEYVSKKTLDIDLIMSMNLANAKYTFKENTVRMNDFAFGFDGFVSMPAEDIDMDITYSGQDISMKSILSLIPGDYQSYLNGVTAGGEINFDGFVRGTYNENLLPTVNTKFNIKNGNIRYAEYPIPMEQINVATELNVPGENMNDMSFNMPQFSMLVDGEKVSATMSFENLENYTWAFSMNGNMDLEKILKIVPIEDTQLKGKIKADFQTSGNMALVEAEKYDQLPASGSMSITDFYFSSLDLPQGFGIASSNMSFNPKNITLANFDGTIGKSDIHLDGILQNYIGFALDSTQVLTGQLNFTSNSFDLNEWMVEEETVETASGEDSLALEVVRIPMNIDFAMNASMKKIIYDNLNIENLKGKILVKDGAARMEGVDFDMLRGKFTMSGSYVTANLENPSFDFNFGIKGLSIPASFEAFNTVQKLAPVAKNVTGNFSTDFKIGGVLGPDMMPLYDKLFGSGLVQIADAALSGSKITSAITTVTKLKGSSASESSDGVKIKDVIMDAEIKDGRLHVKPFDVNMGGYKTTVSGSNGILGDLDYNLKMDVPAGAAGAALNSALASFTGGKSVVGENIKLNLGLGGTYDDPKVKLLGTGAGDGGAGGAAKAAAKAAFDEQKAKAQAELDKKKAEAEAEIAKKKAEAEAKAKAELEQKKKEAEEKAKAEAEKLKKEAEEKAKDAIKGLFKKK